MGEKDAEENIRRKERSRLRQNSVMDEDEEEEPDEEKEMKRKEPGHRRQNRMRQESVPVKGPEDKDECMETLIREKTMVEILLRKYGFGSWTRPDELFRRSFRDLLLLKYEE
eukprot:TRINITY_DN56212_c0_g1_i1.p1 TRINITY_DN56212_c0_g1~~TRINITY_DN56212_c0_g1_i1.p1  ORF type:complete len:129 (-),score=56.27 TRINITY_DN56212_c0_g1_i1:32-367(-)